ncbi:MAG: hypothetical protein ACRESK_02355, partial [Gammaproteobacteria bacterium]
HTEPGINTPGYRTDEIRRLYKAERDPAKKRVKGAMLAGSLLNRGADIMTAIVDLQEAGVMIGTGHPLLKECGKCFLEALQLGENVRLGSGGEGLDELWGEPFKVFSMTMEKFYESRYIKVALTMSEIDKITNILTTIIDKYPALAEAIPKIRELGEAAKLACETIRSDPVIFEVWPRYVAAREALEDYVEEYLREHELEYGNGNGRKTIIELIRDGGGLLQRLSTVRVPMPETTNKFIDKCNKLLQAQPGTKPPGS